MANVSRFATQSRNSDNRIRAALTAANSGRSGESPRAISSAFRKRRHFTSFGRNSSAKVVLPAPLQPAMTYKTGKLLLTAPIGRGFVGGGQCCSFRPVQLGAGHCFGRFGRRPEMVQEGF